MITLQSVHKRYGTLTALHDISLYCRDGTTTILLGESGSGKSTILRLVAGLVSADAGTVSIAGEVLTAAILANVRARMGYVIQEGGLFPHLTAHENVLLMARFLGWSDAQMQKRCSELLDVVRLPVDALTRYPVQLSGGQRQRVALMRALMLEPHILLLDEPFAALDPLVRREIQRDVRQIIAELRITTLLVTHDIREAEFFCKGEMSNGSDNETRHKASSEAGSGDEGNTIVMLQNGTIIQQGTMRSLRHAPANAFVEAFLALGSF
jgi:osmoprotectant transport system ATP-binding protein